MFNNTVSTVLVGLFAIAWFAGGFWFLSTMPKKQVVYDCQLSEISPDFPIEAREACRKMRAQSGRF